MTEHPPEALRRRLARYFDRIPHLAYVGVSPSSRHGEMAFAFALDLSPMSSTGREWVDASLEAGRLLWRVARLLRVTSVRQGDDGPLPWERVIYVRDPLHPCWARWRETQDAMRAASAAMGW